MYDTINFKIDKGDYENEDFINIATKYLDAETITFHSGNYGEYITGKTGMLGIVATKNQLKISKGSLCKWYLGDNYQTMDRGDVKLSIEKLADTLHLPIERAEVTRIDIATNLIMQYPLSIYYKRLGELKHSQRLIQPYSLYYNNLNGLICFYDKNKENKGYIPELYKNKNVLRYEQRYLRRLPNNLQCHSITGEMLYNEEFYMKLKKNWRLKYEQIHKICDYNLNFKQMKGVKTLKQMGLISLINSVGGELEMMSLIKDAQLKGEIDRKQAMDMKKAIKEALLLGQETIIEDEAINELTKKIKEATRYYR